MPALVVQIETSQTKAPERKNVSVTGKDWSPFRFGGSGYCSKCQQHRKNTPAFLFADQCFSCNLYTVDVWLWFGRVDNTFGIVS